MWIDVIIAVYYQSFLQSTTIYIYYHNNAHSPAVVHANNFNIVHFLLFGYTYCMIKFVVNKFLFLTDFILSIIMSILLTYIYMNIYDLIKYINTYYNIIIVYIYMYLKCYINNSI